MTDQQLSSQVLSKSSKVWVVIPAAGIGQRMKSELPKQYLKIHDKTLIEHTLDCFLGHEQVAGIIVVLNPDDQDWQFLNIESKTTPLFTVNGGSNRSDSVIQGLRCLDEEHNIPANTWVMVHDAARPCLTKTDLNALLELREINCIGGLLASPVTDTMKRSVNNKSSDSLKSVSHTESRENLWHALTPQMFRLGTLQKALTHSVSKRYKVTDECSAMEFMGEKPILVKSTHNNIKITNPSDIALASFLLSTNNISEEEA
ncbi:MAG: 2-C-methyl-D-erythritol 4-phosphate cytidylyltransferase [Cocleimonas sp.]